MIDERYYVKIVPSNGEVVHRFSVRRRHVVAALASIALMLVSVLAFAGAQVASAQERVASLQRQTEQQQARLAAVDQKTKALQSQLLRVLNIQHMRTAARARLIAAIPSIDPVDGADIVGCFCYRSYPDAEFHEGVDLDADYGASVRAAADGTIVEAGYDGAYGIKVDIDHGNGYHTWYAHLSHVDVTVGQHVDKGEPIAEVGATGFATGPHLHYQLMYKGQPIDPTPFLHGVPSHVLASLP